MLTDREKKCLAHVPRDQCPVVAEELGRVENSEQLEHVDRLSVAVRDPFLYPATTLS
jgi:hypothetical protein